MYHYPCDPKARTFDGGKPYLHPIIESAFKQTLFYKRRSFGNAHCLDLFESSLPEKPDEKELPTGAVALIATAVYASLNDWSSGEQSVSNFDGESFTNVYALHTQVLETIKKKNAKKYHVLMHGLLNRIIGVKAKVKNEKTTAVEKALRLVDVDAMADSD
ncbi:uncharacterized protein B0H18DRAFT_1079147 [Fomitopsis serialis]|uniref:uncharacterized protein n=1 Tax=Fomitopsis serialis TaxID=139415 RepID=UPI00200850DE|nr:uncharacterized protein B0H18DRAFT_1079147 [Neoantrodia serialis]KAH9906585.1 hypothetical protein B0H18DRAFT_1079147 [Neoantrodia serialis]